MSLLDLGRQQGAAQPARLLVDGLSRMNGALARHNLYRQTVRELNALSDRDLADLGLNRGMIRSVARDSVDATRG